MTAQLTEIALPNGVCFFAVEVDELGDGQVALRVDLADPDSTSVEDLRSAATEVAHLVKTIPTQKPVGQLLVTNWGPVTPPYRSYLIDKHFDEHPWDGNPSHEAELALWEHIDYAF